MLFIKIKNFSLIVLFLIVLFCSVVAVNATAIEDSVSAEIASDNMDTINTGSSNQNINEKALSTNNILSKNKEGHESSIKTSNEADNFSQLQKIIDETESSGSIVLTRDYKADESLKTINITKAITIYGNGHTLDASWFSFIFNVQADNVTIQNIKLVNGENNEQAGAIYWNASYGKLLDSTFINNFGKYGGAVYLVKGNNMINNSIFYENEAGMYGGAVYVGQKDTIITNNLFEKNKALFGKNYAVYTPNDEHIKIYENNTFINNTKLDFGGDDDDYHRGYHGDESSFEIQKQEKLKLFTILGHKGYDKEVSHESIVVNTNNKEILLTHNQLTLGLLNQIFNQDFTNGHLLVYIDGKLVFNGTTTDDLIQLISNLLDLLNGNHKIRVEFTDKEGNTNSFTDNITI